VKTDPQTFPVVLRSFVYRRLDSIFASDVKDKACLAKWHDLRERTYASLLAMVCYAPVLLVTALGLDMVRGREVEFPLFSRAVLAVIVGGYIGMAWNSRMLWRCVIFRLGYR
jgi:hypothetical protein